MLTRRNRVQRLAPRALRRAAFDQPAPAEISLIAVEPVASLFARLARASPFRITRARVAQRFAHHERVQSPAAVVVDHDPVFEALAGGRVARQLSHDARAHAEETRNRKSNSEKRGA